MKKNHHHHGTDGLTKEKLVSPISFLLKHAKIPSGHGGDFSIKIINLELPLIK